MTNLLSEAENVLRQFSHVIYGYVDVNGHIHRESDEDFDNAEFTDYRLQGPEQTKRSQVGVCWDQVEYARHLFAQQSIKTESYAIVYYDHENNNYFNHTILVLEDDGKVYWFEHSLSFFAGIHEFNNLKKLLHTFRKVFLESQKHNIPKEYIPERLCIWRYDAIPAGSTPLEIFRAWERGENVEV